MANIWKQSECLSVDEWIKQMQQVYATEGYSAVRKEDALHLGNVDRPGAHYAEYEKQTEKDNITYV